MGPFVGKLIDRLVPWYASLVAVWMLVVFQAIQVGAGGINIGAVIIATFGLDVFRQMLQVSLSTAVFRYVKLRYMLLNRKNNFDRYLVSHWPLELA